jgi:hypothetical protein
MAKTVSKAKSRRQESKKSSGQALHPPPALLEGENKAAYDELLTQVTAAVKPKDILEEFWVRMWLILPGRHCDYAGSKPR